jgi:aerobic carbon-monoxide dehydrogenase large subunit
VTSRTGAQCLWGRQWRLGEARTTSNPLGVKGAGEAGAVGAPPAVINAIVDALSRRSRVRHIDMPATPRRVWEALNAGR